jgi:hypothetical protein
MELKNAATGLGWDEAKQIVDCDDACVGIWAALGLLLPCYLGRPNFI